MENSIIDFVHDGENYFAIQCIKSAAQADPLVGEVAIVDLALLPENFSVKDLLFGYASNIVFPVKPTEGFLFVVGKYPKPKTT